MRSFKQMLLEAKQGLAYWVEKAKLDFSVSLDTALRAQGMNQKQLAAKMGTSQAYISQVLSADKNMTIEQMVKISRALDSELSIKINPANNYIRYANLDNPANDMAANATVTATTGTISKIDSARLKRFIDTANNSAHEKETELLQATA